MAAKFRSLLAPALFPSFLQFHSFFPSHPDPPPTPTPIAFGRVSENICSTRPYIRKLASVCGCCFCRGKKHSAFDWYLNRCVPLRRLLEGNLGDFVEHDDLTWLPEHYWLVRNKLLAIKQNLCLDCFLPKGDCSKEMRATSRSAYQLIALWGQPSGGTQKLFLRKVQKKCF